MEFLRSQLEQIRRHLAQLSTAAKMAAILLAIVVAASLAWIISAAARPERVAVLETPLAGEELVRAQQVIRQQGIEVEVDSGLLMVPENQKDGAYVALLAEDISGPDGTKDLLQKALATSAFRTRDQSDRIWAQVEQAKLSYLIGFFPGVKQAHVMLKAGNPVGFGRRHVAPTASVHLVMKSGKSPTSRNRRAMADMVCGAVSDLKRSDVRIVDSTTGQSWTGGDERGSDDEDLEAIQQWQARCESNVRKALGEIGGLLVAVFPVPDSTESVQTHKTEYDDPVSGKAESASAESRNAGGQAAEPGFAANAGGLSVSAAGGGGSTESSESRSLMRFPGTITRKIEGRAKGLKDISVSVGVPLSYLVRFFQKMPGNDDSSEPTDSDLDNLLARIGERVRASLPITDDRQMHVDWYLDTTPEPVQEVAAGVLNNITTNGKNVALGGLAVLALGMVMMFARRRAPEPPSFDSKSTPGGLLDTTVGAVDGSEGALEGIELDEEAIHSQRVVDQVGDMVRERPDNAANLVRRWIEQG